MNPFTSPHKRNDSITPNDSLKTPEKISDASRIVYPEKPYKPIIHKKIRWEDSPTPPFLHSLLEEVDGDEDIDAELAEVDWNIPRPTKNRPPTPIVSHIQTRK